MQTLVSEKETDVVPFQRNLEKIHQREILQEILALVAANFLLRSFLKQCSLRQELNLQLNQLDFFPEEIFQLINLKSLHLGWNNISIIPDNISNLKNLESLMIGNNKIGDDISNNLGNLNNLQHLDLGSYGLSKIPDCIFKLKTLKNINLTPQWFADDDPEILKLKKKSAALILYQW